MLYSVVDLFAGAGGLSAGFIANGNYDVKVAFENNQNAKHTYMRNHPNVDIREDVCLADYNEIISTYGDIDVVIGGPPCQGFSNANRQKNHAINMNNMLIKQYVRAVIELEPKAFVMENVSMLKSETHRFYVENSDIDMILEYKIPIRKDRIMLIEQDFCFQGIETYIMSNDKIKKYIWEDKYYLVLNSVYKRKQNANKLSYVLKKNEKALIKLAEYLTVFCEAEDPISVAGATMACNILSYYCDNIPVNDLIVDIEKAIKFQRMLSKSKELIDNDIKVDSYRNENGLYVFVDSFSVLDYLEKVLRSPKHGYAIDSGVLNALHFGVPQKRNRFVVMGVKTNICPEVKLPENDEIKGKDITVRDAIGDLEFIEPTYDVMGERGIRLPEIDNISGFAKSLRDSKELHNHIITKSRDVALERFATLKQGENFHALNEELKNNTYTDASRTQNTIYLRLKYDEPSGTVVNVRKSMWIHPTQNRAISIREAARLQTFKDSFIFEGTKDSQYQQVGNAVPPILARAIAEKLCEIMQHNNK